MQKPTLSAAEIQSKTIDFLRFPLVVGVVLIHARMTDGIFAGGGKFVAADYSVYSAVSYLVSEIFSRLAVPFFFFISGFLFFLKVRDFTPGLYGSKLKRRLRTLLVPYIFWNLAAVALALFLHRFFPAFSRVGVPVGDWTLRDWLSVFWDYKGGMPYNFPLWYLKDLMAMVVVSPVVFFLIRKAPLCFLAAAGILWAFLGWRDLYALFFFSAGAFYGITKRPFVVPARRFAPIAGAVYLVAAAVELCFRDGWGVGYLHNLAIPLGMIALVGLTAHCVGRGVWRVFPLLAASSFYVYVFHALVLWRFRSVLYALFPNATDGSLLAVYFGQVLLTVSLGVASYAFLRRFFPRITAWITGGR